MKIAMVGDVHGHLALMYAILGRWQKESGHQIDLILQCGDMGAFMPDSQLDRATHKRSREDAEELGFGDFAGPSPPTTLMEPRPPLIFIPGNHEDFDFLQAREFSTRNREAIYPVSEDRRIHALKSGRVWTFQKDSTTVRVAGLAGIDVEVRKKSRHPRYYLSHEDALRLADLRTNSVDILISHDGPDQLFRGDFRGMVGSSALRLAVEELQPRYAFFAHYDLAREWKIGTTEVFGLGKCGYTPSGNWPITRGGIAIVSWNEREPTVEPLNTEWLDKGTRANWRHWGVL